MNFLNKESQDLKIIYEMHVKGFTQLDSKVPFYKRGKYLGVLEKIDHLKKMGVDAVQMVVFDCKSSYWGYDVTSWTKLNPKYGTFQEFLTMVQTLQANGIKVILDVVYNHTAEPIKGVKYYDWNVTGCENTVDVLGSLPTIMKSIDFWMDIVDGMRFDLAGVMGREGGDFNPNARFFKEMEKHSKNGKILIAEPYDLGEYSLGRFPKNWLEINTKIRDQIRKQQMYLHTTFEVERSIGFVTCHDGFTLEDLVSYDNKHNEANSPYPQQQGGEDNNLSHNCGWEGPTNDPQILHWRSLRKLHMLDALYAYPGKIMILMGDELGNTQHGNNNVWNQDNATSWLQWDY